MDLATQIKHSNVADIVCSLCALREGTRLDAGSSVPVCVEQWKFFWRVGEVRQAKMLKDTTAKCKPNTTLKKISYYYYHENIFMKIVAF